MTRLNRTRAVLRGGAAALALVATSVSAQELAGDAGDDEEIVVTARKVEEKLLDVPIAVTKHGRTVGLYIPLRNRPAAEDLAALREAGRRLDEWMAKASVTEDELVTEFKARRRAGRRKRGG